MSEHFMPDSERDDRTEKPEDPEADPTTPEELDKTLADSFPASDPPPAP